MYNDPNGQDVGCAGRDVSHCGNPSNSKSQPASTSTPQRGIVLSVDIVSLETYKPMYQYDPTIVEKDGYNACGIVAGCAAGASYDEVSQAANSNGYEDEFGMQPSQAAATYQAVYGKNNVYVTSQWTIEGVYEALEAGKVVIVDILVSYDNGSYKPSSNGNTVAHFAQVIGVNWETGEVYVGNSLGGTYWTLTFDQFYDVWFNPEKEAKYEAPNSEKTDYWGVAITPYGK